RNQLQENFPAAWLAYIQGDALLAAIGHLPPQGLPILDRLHVTQGITAIGKLQLDHLRPMIRTQCRPAGSRKNCGHIKNTHPSKRAGMGVILVHGCPDQKVMKSTIYDPAYPLGQYRISHSETVCPNR